MNAVIGEYHQLNYKIVCGGCSGGDGCDCDGDVQECIDDGRD